MEELIQQLTQRTGLPADKARQAADVVLGFLKERLPAPIASQVDSLLNGGGGGNALGNLTSGLGGMFGGGGNKS